MDGTGEKSPDQHALVRRIRLGDAAAFETLFRAYFRPLYRVIYDIVGSSAIVDELLQDVFLAIWERRARWDVHGDVKSYLYRAARNRALGWLRHERVERRWQVDAARELPDQSASPAVDAADAKTDDDEFAAALARAIDRLPDRTRQAYVLHREHHFTYAQIAELMGISVKGVEAHISRALKILRNALAGLV